MWLSEKKVNKLLAKYFKKIENPIIIIGEEKQKIFFSFLKKEIESLSKYKLKTESDYYGFDRGDNKMIFGIDNPYSDKTYESNKYYFYFNMENKLNFGSLYENFYFDSVKNLLSFAGALEEEFKELRKKQKIKELRTKTILSTIKELAKEENLDYFTEVDFAKIKLNVKISDSYYMEMQIPYKNFQETLINAREIIASMKVLYKKGIKMQLKRYTASSGVF